MGNLYEQFQEALDEKGMRASSRKSINWLRRKIDDLYGSNPLTYSEMLPESSRVLSPADRKFVGKMYMFKYNPIGKDELPYYDKFPLIFILNMYKNGFLGLNLHYLPPTMRVELMVQLDALRSNDKYDESTRVRISYDLIKSTARFAKAMSIIKRYHKTGITSKIIQVMPDEWVIAAFLPTENFVGAGKVKVWTDTRRKLN
jgi:hypothetical protein